MEQALLSNADSLVILDFETTGLSPDNGDRAIEIGAVRIENGEIIRNFWTPDNPNAKYPKLNTPGNYLSTIEDGSFLKIQDIVISYNLPLEKIFSQSSVSFSMQNVHTFTNYSGWDPDISTTNTNTDYGYDELAHPTPRSFTLGLNVTF